MYKLNIAGIPPFLIGAAFIIAALFASDDNSRFQLAVAGLLISIIGSEMFKLEKSLRPYGWLYQAARLMLPTFMLTYIVGLVIVIVAAV